MMAGAWAGLLLALSGVLHNLLLPDRAGFRKLDMVAAIASGGAAYVAALLVGAGGWTAALMAPAAFAGAVSTITDLRMRLVPDLSSLVVALAALSSAGLEGGPAQIGLAVGSGAACGLILFLAGRMAPRSGKSGIGSGDLLLAGAWGCWLPLQVAPYALIAASTAAVGFYGLRKTIGVKEEAQIAFAPWIVGGFFGTWLVSHAF